MAVPWWQQTQDTVESALTRRRRRPVVGGQARVQSRSYSGSANAAPRRELPIGGLQGRIAYDLARQALAGLAEVTGADSSLPGDRAHRENAERIVRERGGVNAALQTARQVLSAPSRAITGDDYRPAIMDQPGALLGLIQVLAGRQSSQDRYGREDSVGMRSLQRVDRASGRVNNALGIEYPANPIEMAFRVGGAMAVPISRPMQVTAATRTGRNAQRVRNFAVEASLPLRQTNLPTAAAVGGTLGVGLAEVLDTEHNDYTGIGEMLGGGDAPAAAAQEGDEFSFLGTALGGDEFSFLDASMGTSDEFAFLARDSSTPDLVSRTPQDDAEDEESFFTWRNAAIAVGTVLGGTVAARAIRNRVRASQSRLVEESAAGPPLRGTEVRRSRDRGRGRGVVDAAVTAAVQQDQPIRNLANDFLSPDHARRIGYKLDRLTHVSIGARVHDFFRTGRIGTGRYTKVAPMLEAYGRELLPAEQQMLDDAILAARGLDDRAAFGTNPSFTNMDDGQLRNIVTRARNDPKLSKYFDAAMNIARDQREFMVARGLLTREVANRWARKRPHWTPFNRSVLHDEEMNELIGRQFTANKNAVSGQSATTDASSVQAGAVANPFNGLVDRWINLIRMAEMNDVRGDLLNNLAGLGRNPANGKPWVRRLPSNARALDDENTHIVFEGGKRRGYYVSDPSVSKALHFMPRATAGAFETVRQVMQTLNTGTLGTMTSLFAITKSTVYDPTLAMLTRPKGQVFGTLNEALLAMSGGKFHVGPFDPTIYASGMIGGVRYAWDDMIGKMGTRLEAALFQEQDWLRELLGDANAGKLARVLSQSYEDSTKSLMDQMGISSHTLHGSPDPNTPIANIQDIAPSFSTESARQIQQSVLMSGPKPLERALANARSDYARVRASSIARHYTGVIESMHNGFRYQTLKNAQRRTGFDREMDRHASELRRLSADASQHGGSAGINKAAGSFMYANLALQSIYQVAKTMRNPGRFMFNMFATTSSLLALKYMALVTDEDARELEASKTPEQRAAAVTTFMGAEVPIDPLIRIFTAPVIELFDHLTGARTGDWNLDLLDAFDQLLDSTETDQEEALEHAMWQGFRSSVRGAMPFDPFGHPLTAGFAGYMGMDVGMSRFSGGVQEARSQQISPEDQDSPVVDGLASSYWRNVIFSTLGTFGRHMYTMVDDFQRSFGRTQDVEESMNRAAERWVEQAERGSGLLRPLFGDYERVQAVGDENWQMYNDRRQGIDAAVRTLNQGHRLGSARTSQTLPMELPSDDPLPQYAGTQAAMIGMYASRLQWETRQHRAWLSNLGRAAEAIRNSYITSREEVNRQLNENTERRQRITLHLLMRTRHYEGMIARAIGEEGFTFEGFDPEQYRVPITAPTSQ